MSDCDKLIVTTLLQSLLVIIIRIDYKIIMEKIAQAELLLCIEQSTISLYMHHKKLSKSMI